MNDRLVIVGADATFVFGVLYGEGGGGGARPTPTRT